MTHARTLALAVSTMTALAVAGVWLLGANLGAGVLSPDGSYRAVISTASRLQRLLHHDMLDLVFHDSIAPTTASS